MLPDGWTRSKLKFSGISVIDGDRGNAYPNGDDFSSEGYCLFLSAKNVTKFGFVFDERQFISQAKHRALRKGAVLKGDIVLTPRGTVGNIGYFINDTLFAAVRINSGMVVLRNENAKLDSAFLYLVLRSPLIEKQVEQMNFGSAQPQLTVQIINNFILPHPPIAEQRRIAEILSTWDQAIAVQERLVANARAQKKALMQTLLTSKKRLPGFKGEWKTRKFDTIASLAKERVDTTSLPPGARGIELEHIESETGILLGFAEANQQLSLKTPFNTNHVLYGKLRPYLRKFLKPIFSGVASTEIWVLIASRKLCSPEFLYFLVQSPGFEAVVDMSAGSKMPRADWDVVKDAPFLIPELDEQSAISNVLEASEILVRNMQARVRQLQQEKSALMQQLLTGKRRVKVEAVEPDLENQNPRLAKERSNGN